MSQQDQDQNHGAIEEGYETPTSEEHKIPPVCLRCPPPAPKKRTRILMDNNRRIRNWKLMLSGELLDVEFQSFLLLRSQPQPQPQPQSPPMREQEPEPDQGTSTN
ncbi:hypothetical protein SASPL_101014 [Salvia splendens]|uniref:Uncharacterized protein n=1 Tax=Salvia splendens TaxID=180675 RepID=A0A8X8YU15_SALSN|nr:hypothetical protein SASPL_101014 [Salvia splendens]